MGSERTHPPEEGHGAGAGRRVEEEAQRYPGHEDPDAARDAVDLPEHERTGEPDGAPPPKDDERRNAPD